MTCGNPVCRALSRGKRGERLQRTGLWPAGVNESGVFRIFIFHSKLITYDEKLAVLTLRVLML
jgi:hypothetical protein